MPPSHVTIPSSELQALLREVKRGVEVCKEIGELRLKLQTIASRLSDQADLGRAIEACEDVSRLRVELSAFERRLRELDQDLTPVRPPSRTDIEAAFANSVEFARGQKKPPEKP